MDYNRKAIQLLSECLYDDEKSRAQLAEMHKELIAFSDAIRGNKQAHQWLYDQGYYALSSLLQAFYKNTDALKWLMNHKKEFAAIAGAVNEDKESYLWLINQGYYEYADLSDTIKKII